jgi:hypothetical protein
VCAKWSGRGLVVLLASIFRSDSCRVGDGGGGVNGVGQVGQVS